MRGLRWRAALTIVSLVMVILWYTATTGRGYLLRVDFSFVPDAIGAEVVVDGEVVDTLHMLRRQLINGIRASALPRHAITGAVRLFWISSRIMPTSPVSANGLLEKHLWTSTAASHSFESVA